MCSDNKKVIKGVLKEIDKESKCTQEASTTVEAMKKELSKATIEINIECSNNKPLTGKKINKSQDQC